MSVPAACALREKRKRRLGPDKALGKKLTSRSSAVSERLPETLEGLRSLDESLTRSRKVQRGPAGIKGGTVSSESSSSEIGDVKGQAGRTRLLAQRSRHRLKRYLGELLEEEVHGMSFLERRVVQKTVRDNYCKECDRLLAFANEKCLPMVSDDEVDQAIVEYLNHLFFMGDHSDRGDKVLAAFFDRFPSFSKAGSRRVPRSWRCLKGWRKLTPKKSRLPLPAAIWCGLAWRLCCRNQTPMAVFLLVALDSYGRPGEMLRMKRKEL